MNISRRAALRGGTTAAITAAALPTVAIAAQPDDAELFAAIARWRKHHNVYRKERDRQDAIERRIYANMPSEYKALEREFSAANHATSIDKRSMRQHVKIALLLSDMEPFQRQYHQQLEDAGYDEDVTGNLCATSFDACVAAALVPARTLAGLAAKADMLDAEDIMPGEDGDEIWNVFASDIRRLAGEARS